jgi:hypothetical protein
LVSQLHFEVDYWGESVRNYLFMVFWLVLIPVVHAQDVTDEVAPAVKQSNVLISKARGLALEIRASARDLATFRDPQWEALTALQIAAAATDAKTSLDNLHRCAACSETGIARLVVGDHPDAHKYLIAGLVEIGIEAVAGHYLRNHIPKNKWYWRCVWTLPQGLSLYAHAHAGIHNVSVR